MPGEKVTSAGRRIDAYHPALIELGRVMIDDVVYEVQTAQVTATASGNTQLLAAILLLRFKILAWTIWSDTELRVKIQDAAGTPVVLVDAFPAARGGGIDSVYKENDKLSTANTVLNVNLSGAGNVFVKIWYVEVS